LKENRNGKVKMNEDIESFLKKKNIMEEVFNKFPIDPNTYLCNCHLHQVGF
jgi:hypothetical protein